MNLFWDEERRPTPTKLLKMKVYERDRVGCRLQRCGLRLLLQQRDGYGLQEPVRLACHFSSFFVGTVFREAHAGYG